MTASTPYRLVASDMDGTLLTSDHTISEVTKNTLYRLATERDVKFVFATGRHHLSVSSNRDELLHYFAEQNKTQQTDAPAADCHTVGFFLVTSNGARVHDPSGVLVVEHNLDADIVQALYKQYGMPCTAKKCLQVSVPVTPTQPEQEGLTATAQEEEEEADVGLDEHPDELASTNAYTSDEWFMSSAFLPLEDMEKKFGFRPNLVPFDVNDEANAGKSVFDAFPLEGVGKVCFRSDDRALLAKYETKINAQFGERVSVAFSSLNCLDVMAGGVSKASALIAIGKQLGIPTSSMIAFGDSMNDADMLRQVGKGCLMRNAQTRLLKELPQCERIGHHDEDGVAKKLIETYQLTA